MAVDNVSLQNAVMNGMDVREPKNHLDPDDFIQVFIAQMKNQNPTHPTDSSAILQQMAQISQISASKDMEKTLTDVSATVKTALGNTQMLQATQLIGKHVYVPSKVAPPLTEAGLDGSTYVNGSASAVKISIIDASGKTVRVIDKGAYSQGGLVDFHWDGLDSNGKPCDPKGVYTLSASAVINGKTIDTPTAGAFKVNSVGLNQQNGSINLNLEQLGGTPMEDILKIL